MHAAIRRYLALTTKEIQQFRRNRVLLIQLLLPPTIVLVIFGYALNPKVRDLRLGVVDESLTAESRGFIDSRRTFPGRAPRHIWTSICSS